MAPRYRKAVTPSYRAVVGSRELSPYLAEGDEFDCALHEAHDSQPAALVLSRGLRWGQCSRSRCASRGWPKSWG
jgi:hypothetical protein